jgi:hypothetical protein
MSKQFFLKFYKKRVPRKNPGVFLFYTQSLTSFSFSEFWATDFRHKKFTKILMRINMAKFHEFFCDKNLYDSKFRKTVIRQKVSVKYSWIFSWHVSYELERDILHITPYCVCTRAPPMFVICFLKMHKLEFFRL